MLQFGLIGYPAAHSLSPWIHDQFMRDQGIQGTYDIFEIPPEEFDEKIKKLKDSSLDGFNVTVPYKEKIISQLDEIDVAAKFLGAVNTVKVEDGRWIGYNTDGHGFYNSVAIRFPKALGADKKVLLIGSGGAARGIYYALLQREMSVIDIANRTKEKAAKIISELDGGRFSNALSISDAEKALNNYDVVIQTTSVGMSPNEDQSIVKIMEIKADALFSDIVYRPLKTTFLKQAEALDANLHFGHEMLLHQAAGAFTIWTGTTPDTQAIMKKFENKLRGDS
ncbi:shikimate dehydrogenase [Halobacillus massiliensis]|uniref:shikimate dehydrogenase n=1 Tax=Halobacillus massiliensis TaxID=1926286 RepID=UPI0009E205FD|nr:shikimate dehydrogenase [Halobacillus massiliensis]